jgi:hypothetical protein
MPAESGHPEDQSDVSLDSRFRGNDEGQIHNEPNETVRKISSHGVTASL